MPIDRTEPLSRYRIHKSNGDTTGYTLYTDDRETAVKWSKKEGVIVDEHVDGAWRNITKVAEASE